MIAETPHWMVEEDSRIPCKCRLTRDAVLLLNDSVTTPVPFDNIDFDIGNIGDIVTTNKIIPRRNGIYHISCYVSLESVLDTGEVLLVSLQIDGTPVIITRSTSAATNQTVEFSTDYVESVLAGESITYQLLQNSGGNYNLPTTAARKPRIMVTEQL